MEGMAGQFNTLIAKISDLSETVSGQQAQIAQLSESVDKLSLPNVLSSPSSVEPEMGFSEKIIIMMQDLGRTVTNQGSQVNRLCQVVDSLQSQVKTLCELVNMLQTCITSMPHPQPTESGKPLPERYTGSGANFEKIKNRCLSEQERCRRFTEGLCLYCGGKGHWLRDCSRRLGKLFSGTPSRNSVTAAQRPRKPSTCSENLCVEPDHVLRDGGSAGAFELCDIRSETEQSQPKEELGVGGTNVRVENAAPGSSSNGSPDRSHTCSVCKEQFGGRWRLRRHELEIHGKKPDKVTIGFTEIKNLTPQLVFRPDSDLKHSCSECGKWFPNYASLTCHKKTHGEVKKFFFCPECEEPFSHLADLLKHKAKHTKKRRIQCSECGKCFNTDGTEWDGSSLCVKPPICSSCKRSAIRLQACNLKSDHVKYDERSEDESEIMFSCLECGESFSVPDLEYDDDSPMFVEPTVCPSCAEPDVLSSEYEGEMCVGGTDIRVMSDGDSEWGSEMSLPLDCEYQVKPRPEFVPQMGGSVMIPPSRAECGGISASTAALQTAKPSRSTAARLVAKQTRSSVAMQTAKQTHSAAVKQTAKRPRATRHARCSGDS